MKIYSIKPMFQKFLNKDKDILIKYGVSPTTINVLALVISIITGLTIYFSSLNLWILLTIPFLVYIRTAFNALDGMVAREIKAKNQRFGEVLNEFVDRLSDVAIFLGVAFAAYVNTPLALTTLVSILLVSYIGIVGKAAGGIRQYVGLMGKADRMFYLAVASVAIVIFSKTEIMNWLLWFVLCLSLITIVIRFLAIKKELYEPVLKDKAKVKNKK